MVMEYLKLINTQKAKVTHACKYKEEKLHGTMPPSGYSQTMECIFGSITISNQLNAWSWTI
jgi:hypothetical protein